MKKLYSILTIPILLLLHSCSSELPETTDAVTGNSGYFKLDDQLTLLKSDFNSMQDKLRMVFINGPSCGICLRGLDDLNTAIISHLQNDPRAHTFVVHVPTLGAEENHAAASVPLMQGPRISHYWDERGESGLEFQEALGLDMYAWDVWLMYEPGAVWETNSSPPMPDFWQHQLPGLPKELRLDKDHYSKTVMERLAEIPMPEEGKSVEAIQRSDPGLLTVRQPRGVMIQQNHESRGGYKKIKDIMAIRYQGTTEIDDQIYPLTIETRRPNKYKRSITDGEAVSSISWDGEKMTRVGKALWLPDSILVEFLNSYDFDGWMTDWKDKGHQISRLGMKKHDQLLPWVMKAELNSGSSWQVYVDSHTGDAYRLILMNENESEWFSIEFADYQDDGGFRLPNEVRYYEADRLLAVDRFDQIAIETR